MLPIRDHAPAGRFPLITVGVVAVTGVVLALQFFAINPEAFIYEWALVPTRVRPETLVTSMFLHAGIMHFASNMWFLWIFGDNVEERLGKIGFGLFYLAGGVVASLSQLFFMQGIDIPILGASGAVAAVLGYYMMHFGHHTVTTLVPFGGFMETTQLPAQIVLLIWFGTQFLNGTASLAVETGATGGVAWWAHIGGFAFGMVVGKLTMRRRSRIHEF